MSDSTQVSASRAITVPFHGAELYVVEHNGQPYTPMKPIVEGMGLAWQPQHRKLTANQARWGVEEISILSTIVESTTVGSNLRHHDGDAGQRRAMTVLPLRKLPGWLATIDPGRVKNEEARAKVVEYQNECDDVLWKYWNEGIAINPRAAYSANPGDALTKEEADTLRQLVEGMAKKLTSDTKVQGKFIMQAWSKLKAHFHVSYREIPRHELTEAISIVNRHTVEWEVVDEAPRAGTVNEIVADWVKKIETPNGYGFLPFLPLVEAVQRKMGVAKSAPTIDARGLLLGPQSEMDIPMPPEVQVAIDRKAMALAFEAYELSRQHLSRRVIYEAATGGPEMTIDVPLAKQAVERGNLSEALAYTYHSELRALHRRAEFFLSGVQDFMGSLAGGAGIAPAH